jgi:hypothetical protein
VRHKGLLCDHPIVVDIKDFEQPLTKYPRQIAVLYEGHLVESLLLEILLAIGHKASQCKVLIEITQVRQQRFGQKLSIKSFIIVLNEY